MRLGLFLAFLILVAFTGGGSRHDILSLVVMRPVSALFLAVALVMSLNAEKRIPKAPLLLIVAVMALALVQLVPLPPAVWSSLPGRKEVLAADALVGLGDLWRPLSLTPTRTLNALFSLIVPAAAVVLYANLSIAQRRMVPGLIIAIGCLSMVWGLAQLIGGADSALYTYRVHTDNKPIGLFSNRNHSAMFLSLTILFVVWCVLRLPDLSKRRLLTAIALLAYTVLALLLVFILGSRAGLALSVFAALVGAVLIVSAPWVRRSAPGVQARPAPFGLAEFGPKGRFFGPAAVVGGFAILGALALMTNRGEAFSRLTDGDGSTPFDRSEVLPLLLRITGDQWVWGSGLGSFDSLFRTYEPLSMLSTTYLNQAHNDWLQIAIEGGMPGLLILAAFMAWLARRTIQIARSTVRGAAAPQFAILATFGAIGFASMVDYPLRAPAMMVVMALAACLLTEDEAFHAPEPRRRA